MNNKPKSFRKALPGEQDRRPLGGAARAGGPPAGPARPTGVQAQGGPEPGRQGGEGGRRGRWVRALAPRRSLDSISNHTDTPGVGKKPCQRKELSFCGAGKSWSSLLGDCSVASCKGQRALALSSHV